MEEHKRRLDEIDQEQNKIMEELNNLSDDINKKIELQQKLDILKIEKTELEEKITLESLNQQSEIIENITSKKISTYEILKGTETERRLLGIVSTQEFIKYGDTAEKRLEIIFKQINTTINKYLIWKFSIDITKEQVPPTITEVLIPAIEWQLIEFLKNNGNENNISNLSLANGINFENFTNLITSVGNFAGKATGMYTEWKKLINAIDFLSINKQRFKDAKKYEILRNPLKMKEFFEKPIWLTDTNPYEIQAKDVGIEFGEEGEFWITENQQQEIKDKIGNIEIVNSPKTTQLILWLVEKADPFFDATAKLSNQAMDLLDGVDWPLGMIKNMFWMDIIKNINESKFRKGVLDVVLKVLGFSGGFDGLVKRWKYRKIDKELNDIKREQISEIFKEYSDNIPSTIPEANLLSNIFKSKFTIQAFTTLQPYFNIDKTVLASTIKNKLTDINSINPKAIKESVGSSYINTITEIQTVNGNQKQVKKEIIDVNKFERDKDKVVDKYLDYMTKNLTTKPNFLQSIDTSEANQGSNAVAFTIISSLFINKDNVIDGIEAKVFLPSQFINNEPMTTETTSQIIETSTETVKENLTEHQKQKLTEELQKYGSPITAEMLIYSAKKYEIPLSYLASIIKNDSSFGTKGIAVSTKNPWNVGNTDNGNIKNFDSREKGLDACAEVIKQRVDAYKKEYPTTEGIPPIQNLLENRGPDGNGFLPNQANYQQDNPYRIEDGKRKTPMGAYMTAENWPEIVAWFVNNLNERLV